MNDRPSPTGPNGTAGTGPDDVEPTVPLGARPAGATVADVPPEVTRFVGRVRQQLSDLDPEVQDELLDGLVADLSDRVAEDGPGALGDPTSYAGELRAAAGLAPRPRVRVPTLRGRGRAHEALHGVGPRLDAAHAAWDRLLARQSVLTPALLETLRPVWWVLRAWVLVQALDALFGGYPMTVIPSIQGPVVGGLLFVVAALASVQIGRGLVWPGTSRQTAPRLVLLAGNLAAVVLAFAVPGWFQNSYGTTTYYDDAQAAPVGLNTDGSPVYNIFAYGADGQPLTGVQLFDQDGRRLSAVHEDYSWYDDNGHWIKTFPWRNGFASLWNVYPRPQQARDEYDDTVRDPATPELPQPPMAEVPPATLPSAAPSSTPSGPSSTPSGTASPSAGASTPRPTVSPTAPAS